MTQYDATAEENREFKKLLSGKVEPVLYYRAMAGFHGACVTRVIESVDHKHQQCCYVPGTALPTWTLGLGTEGLVSR